MGDRPEKGNKNLLTRTLSLLCVHGGASVSPVAVILLLTACGGGPKAPSDSATSESGVEHETAPTDEDGDGSSSDSDCDDADPARFPGADEVCNGVDDDCDGSADEEAIDAPSWYADADADGFGAGAPAARCEAPPGWVVDGTDCDDLDPDVFPDHAELCATSADDDCDGVVNEADAFDAVAWAPDVDGDHFGDADAAVVGCDAGSGWIPEATDCDDDDPALHPGVRDACNDGIDQDCDGTPRSCPYAGDVGTEAAAASYRWADAYSPYYELVQVGDVTGDGVSDLFVGYFADAAVIAAPDLATASGETELGASGFVLLSDGGPTALSGGVDYTGDGTPDLLAGFDGDDTSAENAGRIDIIEGPITASGDLPTACGTFYGQAAGDVLDQSFPGADFNSDGAADLLLATYQSGDHAGAVYVFWGPVPCATNGVGEAELILRGEPDSLFGWDTSPADLDLDGLPDLVVGASGASTYVGSVRVFSGTTLAAGGDDHAPDATWEGEGGMFGYYVDVSGDADGDGLNDLVSTAYRYGSGTFDQPGRVYVFYSPGLGSGAAADADVTLDGDANTNGGGGGHWAGDINADGYSDLLVTNPDLEVDTGATGAVFLFYGPVSGDLTRNTDADATIRAPSGAGGFGATLYQPADYGVGDVDGDGADDFIVPAIDSGSVWLFHGGT